MDEPLSEPAKAAAKPHRVASFVIGVVLGLVLVLCLLVPGPRAVGLAYRAACGANLGTIGRGVALYLTEYGATPRDFQALLDKEFVSPGLLCCPGRARVEKVAPGAPWQDRCDYVWTAPLTFDFEDRRIAAFELPGNHRNEGANVLMTGAST
ncbi:MAG TPA: hypothetical protein VM389_00850, partial [Phycisphaerae bacterium]|nr:hypothetical protein [Phycisphaerae bacterium]